MVTVSGVTTATTSTTVQTTTVMLRQILHLALFLWDFPLDTIAARDKPKAGTIRKKEMIAPPHVDNVQRENRKAHIAIPE